MAYREPPYYPFLTWGGVTYPEIPEDAAIVNARASLVVTAHPMASAPLVQNIDDPATAPWLWSPADVPTPVGTKGNGTPAAKEWRGQVLGFRFGMLDTTPRNTVSRVRCFLYRKRYADDALSGPVTPDSVNLARLVGNNAPLTYAGGTVGCEDGGLTDALWTLAPIRALPVNAEPFTLTPRDTLVAQIASLPVPGDPGATVLGKLVVCRAAIAFWPVEGDQ